MTNTTTCDFSWGSFPEFLTIHCAMDAEAVVLICLVLAMGVLLIGYLLLKFGTERFKKTENERIEREIRMRVTGRRSVSKEKPGCSFAVTATSEADQEWYRCRTCYGISEMGCCSACAIICHKGHDLEKSQSAHHREERYCSCGASGRCVQNADFDASLRENVLRFYIEADADGKIPAPTNLRFHWHAGVDRSYFSSVFTNAQEEEDTRIFEYDQQKGELIAMGGALSGHDEDTAEQAIAAEWDAVYNKIDIDGDGVLSAKEIQDYFQKNKELQEKLSVGDQLSFENLLKRLDSDGDGVVDRSEFAVLVQELGLVNSVPTSLEVAVNCAKDLVAADALGTSDPFVEVRCVQGFDGTLNQVTSVKKKNLNPVWNERFKFALATTAVQFQINFVVYDQDKVGEPDFLGHAEVRFAPNELSSLATKTQETTLRLAGRPGNAGDVQLIRLHRGKLGYLVVTLRAHIDQTEQDTRIKKVGDAGRTLCRECRRKLFFIPKISDTKQWLDSQGIARRVKLLPHCICGAELLPDGWRDDLRQTFEQYRSAGEHDQTKIESCYPLAYHLSPGRIVAYILKITFVAINIAGIILQWIKRPERDPDQDFNLLVLCLVWGELIYLCLRGLVLVQSSYLVGWWGMSAMLPDTILGAHALRIVAVGWFPTMWLRRFQTTHQRTTIMQTRHFVARVGIAIAIVGCFLFFVPLPVYVVVAKLALFRHLFGTSVLPDGSVNLSFADIVIVANFANNLRNVMDVVSDSTPTELRLPKGLWLAVVQRLRGPDGERLKTVLGLLSFPPKERSLPLLYEVFVLNKDSVYHSKRTDDDDRKNETHGATDTFADTGTDLEKPLLDQNNSTLPGGEGGGWFGDATEKLQGEIERLELESIHARAEVKKLRDEIIALETLQLTATSPVQMAVRRVLIDFLEKINSNVQHQLQQGLAIAEGRNKDLVDLVKKVSDNPLLDNNVKTILIDSLGGKYGVAKRADDDSFALPSPPVVFPPSRQQRRVDHSQPTTLLRAHTAGPGYPPSGVSNPLIPSANEAEFLETPLALPDLPPEGGEGWRPSPLDGGGGGGGGGGSVTLGSPPLSMSRSPKSISVTPGQRAPASPFARHESSPSRATKAKHFSHLTKYAVPKEDQNVERSDKRDGRRSMMIMPPV